MLIQFHNAHNKNDYYDVSPMNDETVEGSLCSSSREKCDEKESHAAPMLKAVASNSYLQQRNVGVTPKNKI